MDSDGGDAYTKGILDAIASLNPREQAALESYYRLGRTFEQTGMTLGIRGNSARQVVAGAIMKLRHKSIRQKMSVMEIIGNLETQLLDATAKTDYLYKQIECLLNYGNIDPELQAELDTRKTSICDIGFSPRVSRFLIWSGINTVEALLALKSLDVLMDQRGFGVKSRDEIITIMRTRGYCDWAERIT